MSLFGSFTTAISGLNSQSRALGHVSDNIANSQTVGFKRTDTNFVSYVTQSGETAHSPGSVIARPDYTNALQGAIEQSESPLSMAIGGQGFFSVAAAAGTAADGTPRFDDRQFYSRAGDFRRDDDGYLVNGSGYFLQGWLADETGKLDRTATKPIRIDEGVSKPVPTARVELGAVLPADAAAGEAVSTQARVYDALGKERTLNLTFTRTAADTWTLGLGAPNAAGGVDAIGTAELRFGAGGVLDSIAGGNPPLTPLPGGAGMPAGVAFNADFGRGAQPITLSLGRFGAAEGLTQFAVKQFDVRSLTGDGAPPSAFAGIGVRENGDVAVNYDNGQSRVIARVPVVAFNDPDKLQRLDGQAFMRTAESGEARVAEAASNGAGKLVTGALERSNVDIASEFTKLIVAQRAYTANTRVVTTSDEMLQETLNMRR